jgi:hypothetical protein
MTPQQATKIISELVKLNEKQERIIKELRKIQGDTIRISSTGIKIT